jgi:phosphoribosyl-ATP pyrophosphohydrolase/phosphoribosyl-AMP cyclohydrolase
VETALAAAAGEQAELVEESADLLYHLLVLLRARGLGLSDITGALKSRHGGS